jgi:DNA-binding GntR family transcriptional regulator
VKVETDAILTTGLADELAFRLERKIFDGEYPPGTHLTQDILCRQFGVSRTPVREALRILQAQKLVVVIPNKGATVRAISREELVEIYTVRAELEGFASELATTNSSAPLLAGLSEAQRVLEDAVVRFERGEIGAEEESSFAATIHAANEDFHRAIYAAAGNAHLGRIIENVRAIFPKDYLWQAVRISKGGLRELNVYDHRRIEGFLRAGDAAGARRAMTEHVLHAGTALQDYLEGRGFWKSPAPSAAATR